MKDIRRSAFLASLPVLAGYVVLGFGFGLLMRAAGFGLPLALAMSLFIYAGSMQYVAVGLLTGGAPLLTVLLTTVMVNARHLFYGLSMLEPYKDAGKKKPYLIFALTDETYSLVCRGRPDIPPERRTDYDFLVSLFDQSYWVLGTVLGVAAGTLLQFDSTGIDFALTALFLTVFLEQWLTEKRRAPALTGLAASLVCLLIFGGGEFLIPSMLLIALALCLLPERGEEGSADG